MRCRECAAEVAVTARVCSECGAPIVGQEPPAVADAVVADTVVAAVSAAAGKAVPAGVAVLALPEPYVPGSGDSGLPRVFRTVEFVLFHAAACSFRYSLRTSCGVRYAKGAITWLMTLEATPTEAPPPPPPTVRLTGDLT
jgi:hypothetical protein